MQIQTNQKQRELKDHGTFAFPVNISHENLFSYERSSFFWHWHPEIELTLIVSGDINYQVNDKTYHLTTGEGLFCNANMPHTGHMYNKEDCVYISTTFDPRIIYGFESSRIQTAYVTPLTLDDRFSSIKFSPDVAWQAEILANLTKIWEISSSKAPCWDFQIQILLSRIWLILYQNTEPQTETLPAVQRDRERLLVLLSYLRDHYQEKILLEQVAAQINICKSECCRFFKSHMNESLFDYLLHYRIQKSLPLLQNTNKSITDISLKFSNPKWDARRGSIAKMHSRLLRRKLSQNDRRKHGNTAKSFPYT